MLSASARRQVLGIAIAAAVLCFGSDAAYPAPSLNIEIPFQKFILTNGLTLIVHEDHKAPIVAVDLWYHVGSKNEKPGKTGFAHLFEHLMFSGSEHLNAHGNQRAFFETLERIGATTVNGTTDQDRTDFFENVPTNALDVALWLESDRMGFLLPSVDQARLDTQRGVVQNEKRQGENQPYGIAEQLITKGTAPPEHPYSWTTIGSMEDLNAASLDDVRQWFKSYYGAANAVLVLAGDIDPATALAKANQYFGNIPSGPPVAAYKQWIPEIRGTRREVASDRVPQARMYKIWNIPAYGEPDTIRLMLAANILGEGKASRLYKRLVYSEQLATDVSAQVWAGEISSQFAIIVTARPGQPLDPIEKIVDEELSKFLAHGPSSTELQNARTSEFSSFIRSAERIGGFGGKADILAMNQTFRGSPDFYQTLLQGWRRAGAADVRDATRRWITSNVYVLDINPYPPYGMTGMPADRSALPAPATPPEPRFPALQRASLPNGLKIVLAERHSVPVIEFGMLFNAGWAADPANTPGIARFATDMLQQGTTHRSALEISENLDAAGATLTTDSDLDTCTVRLSALTSMLNPALDIYSDVILNPTFPETDFNRVRKEILARIQQEKTQPSNMALRVLPRLLYGPNHPYANPMTGSGTSSSVEHMTRAEAERFYQTWFRPDNATLVIVGDTTLQKIMPRLTASFGNWKQAPLPERHVTTVPPRSRPAIYAIDRPGSIQSLIYVSELAPPRSNPLEIPIETLNQILGGSFTSRINMNLREDKHWAYGAHSLIFETKAQRPFIAYAPVQTDKTKEAMLEIEKELKDIVGPKPVTADELKLAQQYITLRLPGIWETSASILRSISEMTKFNLPDDYFNTLPSKVLNLTVSDEEHAAAALIHPDRLVWVVVGDLSRIEPGLRELGWGPIEHLDTDGNLVK